jgi:hypothetical protein
MRLLLTVRCEKSVKGKHLHHQPWRAIVQGRFACAGTANLGSGAGARGSEAEFDNRRETRSQEEMHISVVEASLRQTVRKKTPAGHGRRGGRWPVA